VWNLRGDKPRLNSPHTKLLMLCLTACECVCTRRQMQLTAAVCRRAIIRSIGVRRSFKNRRRDTSLSEDQTDVSPLHGWEGNRRLGIALAISHRRTWSIHLYSLRVWVQGPNKGDDHSRAYTSLLGYGARSTEVLLCHDITEN